jgi:hypothetical protein
MLSNGLLGTVRQDLLHELIITDLSILVSVKLLHQNVHIMIVYINASRLKKPSQFIACYDPIMVHITELKRLVNIEIRLIIDILSQPLTSNLYFHVSPPQVFEEVSRTVAEANISRLVLNAYFVSASPVEHAGIEPIKRTNGITKL